MFQPHSLSCQPYLDSLIKLGVGKNMVSSINHWIKSFGISNKEEKLVLCCLNWRYWVSTVSTYIYLHANKEFVSGFQATLYHAKDNSNSLKKKRLLLIK
jgi:hypothetical protein